MAAFRPVRGVEQDIPLVEPENDGAHPGRRDPDIVQNMLRRAVVLHRKGNLDDAKSLYLEVLRINPDHFDALHLLGVIAARTRRHEEAERLFMRAISINSEFAEAHYNRAVALKDLKRLDDALASYDRAIALKPDYAEAHNSRGNALKALGRLDEALASHARAIELKPDYAEAFNNQGNALKALGRPGDALSSYERSIALGPDNADAHNNRGSALKDLGRAEEAVQAYDRAIALKPDNAEIFYNRGNALLDLKRLDAALASYDRAIALKAGHAKAHANSGGLLVEMKRLDDALASYDRAIASSDDHAGAYFNKSMALLLGGNFHEGWKLYEWRKRVKEPSGARTFGKPLWLGESDISGKTILVHWEQGLGDTIQFCRYVQLLDEAGARVLFAPQKSLRGLMKGLAAPCEIVDENDASLAFDFHAPLPSLPLAFRTTASTIPRNIPYLAANDELVRKWKAIIGHDGFRIGVLWRGSDKGAELGRSFQLSDLRPVASLPNVRIVSLQKHSGLGELENWISMSVSAPSAPVEKPPVGPPVPSVNVTRTEPDAPR